MNAYVVVKGGTVVEIARPVQGRLEIETNFSHVRSMSEHDWPSDGVWFTGIEFRRLKMQATGKPKLLNVRRKIAELEEKLGIKSGRAETGMAGISGMAQRADASAAAQSNRREEAKGLYKWLLALKESAVTMSATFPDPHIHVKLEEAALGPSQAPGRYLVHPTSNKRTLRLIGPFNHRDQAATFAWAFFSSDKGPDEVRPQTLVLRNADHIRSVLDSGVYEVLGLSGYADGDPTTIVVDDPERVKPGPRGLKPRQLAWDFYKKEAAGRNSHDDTR